MGHGSVTRGRATDHRKGRRTTPLVRGGRPVRSISGLPEIEYQGQGGLLDVALHPDFAENGLVYLYYVMAAEDQPEEPALDNDPRLGPFVNTEDRVLKGGVVWRAPGWRHAG